MHLSKKILIIVVCIVYTFSYVVHNAILGVRAENPLQHTNIVAIFVDKDIYPDISSDIQWYASSYIQGRISNTKATVFPINTSTFKAHDIVKILENIYFDGIDKQTSKLIGTILIGDIPLPVVKHDNFIFPSIYPYVDFEDQQYIYDAESEFFAYNNNPDAQADIRHGIINFKNTTEDYRNYFAKLKNYSQNPSTFVDAKIRYDDFTALKKYFIDDNIQQYANTHIFAEDTAYRRFSSLFLNILQGNYNQDVARLGSDLSAGLTTSLSNDAEYSDDVVLAYNQALLQYGDEMQALFADNSAGLDLATNSNSQTNTQGEIPTYTLLLDTIIKEFLQGYPSLFGDIYSQTMRDNIFAGGRWLDIGSIDTHIYQVAKKDDVFFRNLADQVEPTLKSVNSILEARLDTIIEQNNYHMHIPIPLTYEFHEQVCGKFGGRCRWIVDQYEYFFFGEKAKNVQTLADTHIYRGTYQNLQNIENTTLMSNTGKAVGGSYNIFSQQIEANRGFNFMNAEDEIALWSGQKDQGRRQMRCVEKLVIQCLAKGRVRQGGNGICEDRNGKLLYQGDMKELPLDFSIRIRGGASPLNLTGDPNNSNNFVLNVPDDIAYYKHAMQPIYDIAGSKKLQAEVTDFYDMTAIGGFGSMILAGNKRGPVYYPRCLDDTDQSLDPVSGFVEKETLPSDTVDFFGVFSANIGSNRSVTPRALTLTNTSQKKEKHIRKYKTIDSRYQHTSPTPQQISSTNFYKFQTGSVIRNFYQDTRTVIADTRQDLLGKRAGLGSNAAGGGIVTTINRLKNTIATTNSGIDHIASYDYTLIPSLSPAAINNLATAWSGYAITTDTINTIQETATTLFEDIDTFTINTAGIQSLFDSIIQTEKLKQQNVEILNTWKTILISEFNSIIENIDILRTLVNQARLLYNTVGLLDNQIATLQSQKNAIESLQSGNGCSPTYYQQLCAILTNAINALTTELSDTNTILDKIKQYTEEDQNDNGTWESVEVYPFLEVTTELDNQKIAINSIKSILDTFSVSSDPNKMETNKGMSIVTQDRPIDNIRKISFVGVGGEVVELDYPNLYSVPIYTQTGSQLILQKPEEIVASITSYLREYVNIYNSKLQAQLDKRSSYYNSNVNAFNLLGQHHIQATPNRSYSLIPEDIFVDAVGDEMIASIAEMLYYQNSPRQAKRVEPSIQKDIQQHYDGMDVNQKISQVMELYLTQDNDRGIFINPGYNKTGYEVAYLNSDSIHMIDNGATPGIIGTIQSISDSASNAYKTAIDNAYMADGSNSSSLDNNCNYDPMQAVPLTKWPAAIICWAKELVKKPFALSINFPNTNLTSFGSNFSDQRKGQINNYTQGINDYSTQRSSAIQLEQNNRNIIANLPSADQRSMQDIMQYTVPRSNSSSWSLDSRYNAEDPFVRIFSTQNVGPVTVRVSATGDNCLTAPGRSNNLCSTPVTLTQNFFDTTITIPIVIGNSAQTHSTKAGITTIIFQICKPQSTQSCVYKTQQVNILPGPLDSIEIIAPDEMIRGDRIPVLLIGKDEFANHLGLGLDDYRISATTGLFSNGNNPQSSLVFNDFRKAQFAYIATDTLAHDSIVAINVAAARSGVNTTVSATQSIRIKEPTIQWVYNNTNTDAITYTLPNSFSHLHSVDGSGVMQVNFSEIPQITINLRDVSGLPLDTYIRVESRHGLMQPAHRSTRQILVDDKQLTQQVLAPNNSFFVQSGRITIYLQPSYRAGSDEIILSIPGLEPIIIPVQVNPGAAAKVTINNGMPSFVGVGQPIPVHISVSDIWNNPVLTATDIEVGGLNAIRIDGQRTQTLTATGGIIQTTAMSIEPGGLSYIYAFVKDIPLSQQIPDAVRIAVQYDVLPREGLNVMYLNMFGNDWGNQWGYFSDIDQSYINDRMILSDKLLTTTTQLISPEKLKEVSFLVSSDLAIKNFGGQAISLITSPDNGIVMDIAGTSRIRIGESNTFSLQQINNRQNIALTTITQNTILYIPETTDSVITSNSVTNGQIVINGEPVFDTTTLISRATITLSQDRIQGHTLWNVTVNNTKVGQMLIIRTDQVLLSQAADRTILYDTDAVGMHIIFAEGSTNGKKGIAITQNNSSFVPENNYTSIEDSNEEGLAIGFRAPFKNISNFAAGQHVGEATKRFASVFLINIGDPLVQKISTNKTATDTDFDTSIGHSIYSDPGKTIFKVIPFDFNNDGLDDLLIAHTDGSIKLLKNYGGTDAYKDLQNLMLIADTIKDIYVGDVDGNNYPDIIVRTNNNQLRVYTNNQGIFDVDGKLICLDVALGPDSLDGVTQLFFEDMDQDGRIDIVTNDRHGAVKIFYGGSSSQGSNYVSTLNYACDDDREQRQQSVLVKQFGIQIDEDMRVIDGSMVHRDGLTVPLEDDPNNPLGELVSGIGGMDDATATALENLAKSFEDGLIDAKTFQANLSAIIASQGPIGALNNFDINTLVAQGGTQLLRHTPNPFRYIPRYTTANDTIAYISLPYLTGSDPVAIYKTYEDMDGAMLLEGDTVTVRVHMVAKQNTVLTFADQISGPWIIAQNTDGSFVGWDTETLPDDVYINRDTDVDGFLYMIDNITIGSGETITFSYTMTYAGGSPMAIDIKDVKNDGFTDNYPDIVVSPLDDCAKFVWTYFNQGRTQDTFRSYEEVFADLWENIQSYYDELEGNLGENINDVSSVAGDVGSDAQQELLQTMMNQSWDSQSVFKDVLVSGDPINFNFNLDLAFIDDALAGVSEGLDNALQGMCEGFKIGGGDPCAQPPVPFNMAFLAPGTFNVFGCTLFEDRGLPLFFFPGTIYILGVPVPFPYGLTQPGADTFFRGQGGTFPSMIRIYVSPTLTAQLGFAVCLGPMAGFSNLPQPIRDIGGNCIVMSMAIPCGKSKPKVGPDETYIQQFDPRWMDTGGTCTQGTIAYTERTMNDGVTTDNNYASSPFTLMAQDRFVASPRPLIPVSTQGFGLININADPILVTSSQDNPDSIKIKAGSKINLKIRGGQSKGLMKCIIQDWMDRQIKYIINNLTQMTVGISLPDTDTLFDGIESLNIENLALLFAQEPSVEPINKSAATDASGLKKLSNWAQNNMMQQGQLANASSKASNPFDLVAQMFDDVPIIDMNTRDVVIAVPMIYSEDIIRYSSYLEARLQTNIAIRRDWQNIVRSTLGICDNRVIGEDENLRDVIALIRSRVQTRKQARGSGEDLDALEKCDLFLQNTAMEQFLRVNENMAQMIRAIQQNLNALDQYQQFPLQLYEWMHITDRYLTELSGFISTFFGTISYWLGTNATSFRKYVDTIVTLIGVIQTWQALINFSVNRSENCATCSNDVYDFYSCSLSFLCPQLPILPIPPFKLPSIFLDMSRINLGMQILLPNFKFVPTVIALPNLPNLPSPPRIDVDVDFGILPIITIPILPAPPTLPELPSLVPQVQLDLPILPPAPKIPAISPSIQATLKAAEFIGKIMCIVKGKGVGLVSEGGVKSKIEQMTQRSWNVPFFDFLDLTTQFRDPPLQGFDLQIDTFVDIQFNFNGVYDIVNSIAEQVNEKTSIPFEKVDESITKGSALLNQGIVPSILETIEGNIDIGIPSPINQFNRNDHDIPEVDAEIVRNELIDGLRHLEDIAIQHTDKQTVNHILSSLQKDHGVRAKIDELLAIYDAVQDIVINKQSDIHSIQNQITQDYDGFLDMIQEDSIILVNNNNGSVRFNYSPFTISDSSKQLIAQAPNPLVSYLDMQEGLAQGYKQALVNNDALSLNMHPQTHRSMEQYFDGVLVAAQQGKQLLAANTPIQQPQQIAAINNNATNNTISTVRSLPLLAQIPANTSATNNTNTSQSCVNCGSNPNTAAADLSQYIQGVFVVGNSGQMVNVMQSTTQSQEIQNNYIRHDINNNGSDDIILWDTRNIYVKYAQQVASKPPQSSFYTRYYVTPILQQPNDLATRSNARGYISISAQGGFLSISDTISLKVYDQHTSVKNFRMQGQSFDTLSVAWKHNPLVDINTAGYLLALNHRVDTHHDAFSQLSFISPALIGRGYILVLPEDTLVQNDDRLILPHNNNAINITNSLGNEIIDIIYFDPNTDEVLATLTELSRHRKYMQIAQLTNRGNTATVYERSSPWSNQVVAGTQLLSDTIGPEPEVSFIRNMTEDIISTGLSHIGYVSTDYSFVIEWEDNVAVAYNWIEDAVGNIVGLYTGSSARIDELFFTNMATAVYTIGAIDHQDNVTRTTIDLTINIPEIVVDAVYRSGNYSGSVVARMDMDVDAGIVTFDRRRDDYRRSLTGTQGMETLSLFPVGVGETIVTGYQFDLSDGIGLYSNAGDVFASLDPFNGHIHILDAYKDNYSILGDFLSHVPMIKILDRASNQQIFQIYYNPQDLISTGVTILDNQLTAERLGSIFNSFADGLCIKDTDQCIAYVSAQGHIYAPIPYHTRLKIQISFIDDTVQYLVTTSAGDGLFRVDFMIDPLVP